MTLRPAEHVRLARARGARPGLRAGEVMGTSIEMIERHYGTLLDGSAAGFAERMDAYERDTG